MFVLGLAYRSVGRVALDVLVEMSSASDVSSSGNMAPPPLKDISHACYICTVGYCPCRVVQRRVFALCFVSSLRHMFSTHPHKYTEFRALSSIWRPSTWTFDCYRVNTTRAVRSVRTGSISILVRSVDWHQVPLWAERQGYFSCYISVQGVLIKHYV